jgi:hypothetical protein
VHSVPAPVGADDAQGAAKREKKKEKDLYKTLFKDLPGKHDTKRDHYLVGLVEQQMREGPIMPLDDMTAEMAFTIFDLPQVCLYLFSHRAAEFLANRLLSP